MTGTVETFSEREEIEMLLPWYVTGKLDAADRARVDGWLAREPELARQVELIREEQHASIVANEAIAVPNRMHLKHVAIDARQPPAGPFAWLTDMAGAIGDFFRQPTAGAVRWAAAAVAAIILAQAVVIGSNVWSPSTPGYETASGPANTARDGLVVLVTFQERASIQDITRELAAIDAAIIDGPRAGGLYRVRLSKVKLEGAAADARIAALRQRSSVVARVLPPTGTGGQ